MYALDYLQQRDSMSGKWDIEQAVVRANKASALAITKLGAQEGIPWRDEIEHFDAPLNERQQAEGE